MVRLRLDPEPSPVSSGRNGHRRNGTFAPGNQAAKGRRRRCEYREAFDRACSPDDLEEIVRVAVDQAKQGEPVARAWVGGFVLQKPARLLDVKVSEDDPSPADLTDPANHWLREYL